MHTLIQQALSAKLGSGSLLDLVLPAFVRELQGEFMRFADCGAGVGWTATQYAAMLRQHLTPDHLSGVKIVCYEPLEENFVQMEARLTDREYVLRRAALGDVSGNMTFAVPIRMEGDNGLWTPGTSYGGFLGEYPGMESVSVDVVRLDDDGQGPFDFIKFDLQGGEQAAIRGAGELMSSAKMVYVEHQLLDIGRSAADILEENELFPFFDQIQFGMKAGSAEVPLDLFREIGLSVKRVRLSEGTMPTIMWGVFERAPPLTRTLVFPEDLMIRLRDAGLFYMQTDLLAVAPRYLSVLSRALN